MTKRCIICGEPAEVPTESEIVVCAKDYCIITVENSVGFHQIIYTDLNAIGIDQARAGCDISAMNVCQGNRIIETHYMA